VNIVITPHPGKNILLGLGSAKVKRFLDIGTSTKHIDLTRVAKHIEESENLVLTIQLLRSITHYPFSNPLGTLRRTARAYN